ncbi:hypothetical protein [Pseudomonas sp. 6D_7.1_Bac1]|uniref:hypothetical protein n=1 Tax=Pseudomonas sp. 6D_7.1_Bac1 TaxID=2971615 RepID=UPI0021CA5263|nr:hypothetical protein [Pseudomonas sp. 6D_7.1_Bac1]MCU1750274.1 hypothetical protein [Pseudomonas sp. 6D_7.1_Bac1]
MKPVAQQHLYALAKRALVSLLVIGLSRIATLLTCASVRLYVRGWLSGIEIRFLLGFSSAIHRTALRLAVR